MGARRLGAACLAIGLVACGLSVVGVDKDAPATPDGGGGGIDGGLTSSSSSGGGGGDAGAPSLDAGESVTCDAGVVGAGAVILPADDAPCPPDTTEQTAHRSPQATAGACACGPCTPTADPSCADPTFTWSWGGSNTCSPGTMNFTVPANNACVHVETQNVQIDVYNRWPAVVPVGGTCSAVSVADPTKVSTTTMRQCVPNSNTAVCAALSGQQPMCVPAGAGGSCRGAFSRSVVVGDGATVTCAACGCTRTASSCNVEYHDNPTCTSKQIERLADGTCLATGRPSIQAIKVYPVNPTCTPTAGAATPALTNARTLCCTP